MATADVRMRGFSARHTVEEALAWVDAYARPLSAESVACDDAASRVLAADVIAPRAVPAFDRSAMDGYAVRAADTDGAGDYNPLPLRVVGESLPGRPARLDRPLCEGAAVRIMTGAPLPAGCDAVVPAEYATEANGVVEVTTAVTPGKNVGRVGEDVAAGTTLLATGRRLRPQDLGLIASIGAMRVEVVRRPMVRMIVTGNELVAPGEPCGRHQIYEANSSMLRALVERDGGTMESVCRLPDDRAAIRDALARPGADVLLVSGGSSVGSEDHAPGLVSELGTLDLHGLAMRPSSPAGMGRIGAALVFLLPGNPVSCLCAYDFFAGRAIRRQGGRAAEWPYRRATARLARKIVSVVGRVDYCRVRFDGTRVEPLAISGASILSSTVRADGFVVVPASLEGYAAESDVDVWLYDG